MKCRNIKVSWGARLLFPVAAAAPWRALRLGVVLVGIGLCLAFTPLAQALEVRTMTDMSSRWNLGGGGPAYFARVLADFNNTGIVVGPQDGPAAFKGAAASTSDTGQFPSPVGSGAFVRNFVSSVGTLGFFMASNTFTMTTSVEPGMFQLTRVIGRYLDPFSFQILDSGLIVTAEQDLLAGSQVQARDPLVMGTSLSLVLEARFGEGNFPADDPAVFWPDDPLPPSAHSTYTGSKSSRITWDRSTQSLNCSLAPIPITRSHLARPRHRSRARFQRQLGQGQRDLHLAIEPLRPLRRHHQPAHACGRPGEGRDWLSWGAERQRGAPVLNVTFEPLISTFNTTTDTTGCPFGCGTFQL